MFSFTNKRDLRIERYLREDFIEELNKKIKEESFIYSEQRLREKLRESLKKESEY